MLTNCTTCKKKKDESEGFYWSKGKRMARCKECHKDYVRMWRSCHREVVEAQREKYNLKSRTRKTGAINTQ